MNQLHAALYRRVMRRSTHKQVAPLGESVIEACLHSIHTTRPNIGVFFCSEIGGVNGGTQNVEPGSTTGRSTLPLLYRRLSSVNKWETILHIAAIDSLLWWVISMNEHDRRRWLFMTAICHVVSLCLFVSSSSFSLLLLVCAVPTFFFFFSSL